MSDHDPRPSPQVPAAIQEERRAYVRLARHNPLTCTLAERVHEPGWAGRLHNISQGGCAMLIQHRFRPGTVVAVDVRTSAGTCLPTLRAKVVHVRAVVVDGCTLWLHGCAFENPLAEAELASLR